MKGKNKKQKKKKKTKKKIVKEKNNGKKTCEKKILIYYQPGNFSLHHRVQNGSETHPASYPMCTRSSFPEVKRLGREADHSPPSSAAVNNAWNYTYTLQYAFMVWCSIKKSTGTTLPAPYLRDIW
jgi:hypothetical protein